MNDEIKERHEFIAISMVVEALFALHNDHLGGFREALLNESVKKVEMYEGWKKQGGEDTVQFELRTARAKLADSEAEHSKRHDQRDLANHKLKLENQVWRDRANHKVALPSRQPGEGEAQFELRALQDQIIRSEKDHDHEIRQLKLVAKHRDDALKVSEENREELEVKKERRELENLSLKQEIKQLTVENLTFRLNAVEREKADLQREKFDAQRENSNKKLTKKYEQSKKIISQLKKDYRDDELSCDETERALEKCKHKLKDEKAKSAHLQAKLDKIQG